ncbi:hypothetical protein MtrunA17_Chr1g0209871 [Medicago truncatula]|uniref:Uncharacterized protein n=1 Tax=Medicago truncatula TaxID=3880 RepID=A0A072W1Q8_MEDTR|nr:hypothetical protein MTR_1g110880 [Medicago truncatula]RHN82433.1 hypothetical protein MtrunA17_Chr1g0209871 [Medicago truncatula]
MDLAGCDRISGDVRSRSERDGGVDDRGGKEDGENREKIHEEMKKREDGGEYDGGKDGGRERIVGEGVLCFCREDEEERCRVITVMPQL